jgi:hypothetical protein
MYCCRSDLFSPLVVVRVYRLTRRWEASLWVNRKQLYLGGYNDEVSAARAYDMAALFCKGDKCSTNFPPEDYDEEMKEIQGFSRVRKTRPRHPRFLGHRRIALVPCRWLPIFSFFGGLLTTTVPSRKPW